ncbi:hypothetical protein Tco_0654165 [Tanacetum coccineum]|uniref:Transposase (Putative), gypsy type n=1 Tax=Tanacetum coccineum TaxID=301880 RepID=A0ABQ4X2G3_9ASTR
MANKHSIMTREMVESFCNSYYIPDEVHPTAPGRDKTITQFPEGKVGVYTRLFDYCGYRIPLTKFFVAVLKHFRIHISQLSPFCAARVSHFERSLSAPSCLSKPPDSIKNWADHFFWVDSKVFPISVPLYMGGVLEKDPAPHLTAHMGLLDYIRTADPQKVHAVEVQKGEEQVKLLDSIKHCFVSLDAPAVVQQQGGSGSGAGPEVSAPSAKENVVAEENVIPVGTYLDLMDPEGDLTVAEKGDAAQKQPEKAKRKKLSKQSDTLPAKRLRVDHPSLASGTGGLPHSGTARADAPVYTVADIVTSSRGKTLAAPTSDVGGSSHPETSEESADSFYETEKDVEIARLKSLVEEKETESAEKDTDISLLDSRATYLKSALDDSQAACTEAKNLISTLTSERDGLASKVSTLHYAFCDFKKKMEAQQEAQAQVLYNRVAELEAHVMDVSGRLEGEFYPAY